MTGRDFFQPSRKRFFFSRPVPLLDPSPRVHFFYQLEIARRGKGRINNKHDTSAHRVQRRIIHFIIIPENPFFLLDWKSTGVGITSSTRTRSVDDVSSNPSASTIGLSARRHRNNEVFIQSRHRFFSEMMKISEEEAKMEEKKFQEIQEQWRGNKMDGPTNEPTSFDPLFAEIYSTSSRLRADSRRHHLTRHLPLFLLNKTSIVFFIPRP